jgi:hypothetical protein
MTASFGGTRAKDFVGSGWSYPVGVDMRGRISLSHRERDIEESMVMILLTPKGQRVMRPEFGCEIHELVFAPNNATTAGLAAYYVQEALRMWEPRIEVRRVDANPDSDNDGRLLVQIDYEIKATYDQRSLVFPFYRIPGE